MRAIAMSSRCVFSAADTTSAVVRGELTHDGHSFTEDDFGLCATIGSNRAAGPDDLNDREESSTMQRLDGIDTDGMADARALALAQLGHLHRMSGARRAGVDSARP